jgi:NAD(P)-dependent dehydrogenase (short-subunit alcohol dehydrogenase family)
VTISSGAGLQPSRTGIQAYTSAKHGLIGFSRTIALETADCDVTINTVCPSYVRTPLVEAQIAAQARAHLQEAGLSEWVEIREGDARTAAQRLRLHTNGARRSMVEALRRARDR